MSLLPGAPYDPLGGLFGGMGGMPQMGGMPTLGGARAPQPQQGAPQGGVGGIYQRIMGGLLGQPQNYGGLLDASAQQNAGGEGRQALFAKLLEASGPSTMPTSLGQAFGGAMSAGQKAQNESMERALQAQLMSSQINRNNKADRTNSQQEYEYAKEQGYKGSFEDWKKVSQQVSAGPASIQEYNLYSEQAKAAGKQPEPFDAWMQRRSAMSVGAPFQQGEFGGQRGAFDRTTGGFTPRTTVEQEASAAGAIKEGMSRGGAIGEAVGAQEAKAPAKASFDIAIGNMRAQIEDTMTGMVAGPAGKVFDYGDRKLFDSRNQQLSTELRTVFRIPGEGTLSDREQAQYGLQLPSTDNPPEVNAKILDDLEARAGARQSTPISGASGGAAPTKAKKKYNPATGKIE